LWRYFDAKESIINSIINANKTMEFSYSKLTHKPPPKKHKSIKPGRHEQWPGL